MINQTDVLRIAQKTNGYCLYCPARGEEIDHFVSQYWWKVWKLLELVGMNVNSLENLFLACRSCNRSKRNQHPEDFIGNDNKAWSRYRRANLRIGIITKYG